LVMIIASFCSVKDIEAALSLLHNRRNASRLFERDLKISLNPS